jgi:hypothetical protein
MRQFVEQDAPQLFLGIFAVGQNNRGAKQPD